MRTVRDKLGSVHAQKWKYLPSGLRERCLFPRLGERATQAAGTMSGSEQQMLGIARALMASPKLIIVDELSLGTHASEVARGAVEIGRERDVCLPPPLSAQHIGVLLDIGSDPLAPTTALGDRIDDRLRTVEVRGFNLRGSTSTALLSLLSVQRPFRRFPAKPPAYARHSCRFSQPFVRMIGCVASAPTRPVSSDFWSALASTRAPRPR